jgi:hypothetical protein
MVIKANEIGVKWKGVGGTECSKTAMGPEIMSYFYFSTSSRNSLAGFKIF